MAELLAHLLDKLRPDKWRDRVGFSEEMEKANRGLFAARDDADECARMTNEWLAKYQPCLFGRVAAKLGLLEYSILTESDLLASDQEVRKKIQSARTAWTADGFHGRRSGFIIMLISERVTSAVPDLTMMELARRLCSLYLLTDVTTDEIYLDEVFLEIPTSQRTTWRWDAGVNYFCTQADKRWWQDHRIPGGLAFSVNSVGHMVKSGALGRGMRELERLMGVDATEWSRVKLESLTDALDLAMRTIAMASETVSGKATELLPLEDPTELPACPLSLPDFLRGKNHCTYRGYYHTDMTLPSEYFRPDVERPVGAREHRLDFTYLFHDDVTNPDFYRMGAGRPVRDEDLSSYDKAQKAHATEERIGDFQRLVDALRGQGLGQ